MADGVGTAFASIFNAMPNTSYSQNAGLVAFTGVISRHVGTIAGVMLILLGLFPKLRWNYCGNARFSAWWSSYYNVWINCWSWNQIDFKN